MTPEIFGITPKKQDTASIECAQKNPNGIEISGIVSFRRCDFLYGVAAAFVAGVLTGGVLEAFIIRGFGRN
jgi:hypothetical protein